MTYLLDTNVCIQLWHRNNPVVSSRLAQVPHEDVAICSVVKAELIFGAYRSQRIADNLAKLDKFFAPCSSFDFDDKAALHYGKIRAHLSKIGQIIGANDLMIASIALANDAILVTHNTSEYSRIDGLIIEDWEI